MNPSYEILAQAKKEQEARAVMYDAPGGERSMAKTVAMFNLLTGLAVTETQGWQFMELLKMVRSSQGAFRLDNYVDGASYASLAGEAASRVAASLPADEPVTTPSVTAKKPKARRGR